MARGRMVSTTIATDKALNSLSMEAELLYLKAIPHLDRDGLIAGDDDVLIAKIAPRRQRELFDRMEAAICEWIDAGLVLRYDSKDGQVLFFNGFTKNNKLRYEQEGPSNYPPPPGYTRSATGLAPVDVQSDNVPTTEQQRSNPVVTTLSKPLNTIEEKVNSSQSKRNEGEGAPAGGGGGDPAFARACEAYHESIGLLSKPIADSLADDVTTYGADWVVEAIGIATKAEKRSLSYVEGILRKWRTEGKGAPRTNGNGKHAADPLQAYSMNDLTPGTRATLESMSVERMQAQRADPLDALLAYVDMVAIDPSPARVRKQIEREIDRLVAAGTVTDYTATLTTALERAGLQQGA